MVFLLDALGKIFLKNSASCEVLSPLSLLERSPSLWVLGSGSRGNQLGAWAKGMNLLVSKQAVALKFSPPQTTAKSAVTK